MKIVRKKERIILTKVMAMKMIGGLKRLREQVRGAEKPAILTGLFMLLSACATVGPDYKPPETLNPPQWATETTGIPGEAPSDSETLAQWWSTLEDPVLTGLIERAVRGSLDLKQAASRIREARARRGIAQAERFPTLDARGNAQRTRRGIDTETGKEVDLFSLGFDAGWELDMFGGLRRSVEAADAEIETRIEAYRDVLVTLTSEVALNYVEIRSFQARLAIAEANRDAQTETYEIALARFDAGLTSRLDVEQADFNLQQTQSQIPGTRSALEQAKNRLSVLMGEPPNALETTLAAAQPIPVAPPRIAVGIPADTLRRRPDVRAAERALAAQTARIGVATAELYPRFSLLGSIGLEALSTGDLFRSASRALSPGRSSMPGRFAGTSRSKMRFKNRQ